MEAVFASFLLVTSILMSVLIFDTTLQTEAGNEQRITAAMVAESALDELRAASNGDFDELKKNYDGKTWTLPSYPEFQIRARVETQPLAIPCSELERPFEEKASFPAPERRILSDSVWKCEVTVNWSRRKDQEVRVVGYLADLSPVTDFQVEITPAGSSPIDELTTGTFSVAKNKTLPFRALARADGRLVNDVQFTWYIEPLDGFGSIHRVSREGDQCLYKHAYTNYDGKREHSPGLCNLVVRAVYQGVEATRKVRIQNE